MRASGSSFANARSTPAIALRSSAKSKLVSATSAASAGFSAADGSTPNMARMAGTRRDGTEPGLMAPRHSPHASSSPR